MCLQLPAAERMQNGCNEKMMERSFNRKDRKRDILVNRAHNYKVAILSSLRRPHKHGELIVLTHG